jgi:hypothetical protein
MKVPVCTMAEAIAGLSRFAELSTSARIVRPAKPSTPPRGAAPPAPPAAQPAVCEPSVCERRLPERVEDALVDLLEAVAASYRRRTP